MILSCLKSWRHIKLKESLYFSMNRMEMEKTVGEIGRGIIVGRIHNHEQLLDWPFTRLLLAKGRGILAQAIANFFLVNARRIRNCCCCY